MIGTALFGLALLGAVIGWDKQLPRYGERWATLSGKRKAFTALGIPVGFAVAAVSVPLAAAGSDAEGFYESLAFLLMVSLGISGLVLAGLTARSILRSRR